ncbi:eukaryotic translation initiation factor 3 subunit J-like [Olea europaea subsp. europaea]|uniref:Eukaryotic translation initiation factor 3 subunit J-like n=1 Tax=Olea europaea subsp. europaea TaxID=158383 RepID=A0A8S0UB19_OLEEU|nr:eukaryotic translation initiation factor 3 subunit J-like [Olea europaea subsp. europaea]
MRCEDETIPDLLKKEQLKSNWDDEDVDDNDVKESWEDEDEPAPVDKFLNANVFDNSEDETIPDLLKKEQLKSNWDDEDVDDNDVKESWEDEDEPAPVYLLIV